MLDKYMRRRDGTPVEVVAQGKTFTDTRATVLYLHENNAGKTSVGYAMADGTNPNHVASADLLPFDLDLCANHIQCGLDIPVYEAFQRLWVGKFHDQVVSMATKGTSLHPTDMRHYLTGIWGN